jgi:hypothetical protein
LIGWLTGFSITSIVTPAVVASAVSLYLGSRSEKQRAVRDFITKAFDAARDDVRRASEAAAEYFPLSAEERKPAQAAKIWMGERDVRHSVEALIAFTDATSPRRAVLENRLDDFIDALTGGSFESTAATADVEQVRRVATTSAALRAALSTARQQELSAAIDKDVLARFVKYMKEAL